VSSATCGVREVPLTSPDVEGITREVQQSFHTWFYASRVWQTQWCDGLVLKNPLDLWVYQQIVFGCQVERIVETGTAFGGSALFLAMALDRLGYGKVLTIDKERRRNLPIHQRVRYITGDSTDPDLVAQIAREVRGKRTMVILDSQHTCEHVTRELAAYASLVTPGQYLIVEDTNISGHPIPSDGSGPWEAVQAWLPDHPEFRIDTACEYLGLTFNPGGFLARIA